MDLSQRALELGHELQNLQGSVTADFGQPEAYRHMQIGQVTINESLIKSETQPYHQLPPIKLEPGLGLGKLSYCVVH